MNIDSINKLKAYKDNSQKRYNVSSATESFYINSTASQTLIDDVKNLLDVRFAATDDLVAIIGNELIANGQARLYTEDGCTPRKKSKIEMCQVIATYSGLAFVHCIQLPPARHHGHKL